MINKSESRPLSTNEKKVLAFLTEFYRKNLFMPSTDEIARHMGWKSNGSVCHILDSMEAKGVIRRASYKTRGIYFT